MARLGELSGVSVLIAALFHVALGIYEATVSGSNPITMLNPQSYYDYQAYAFVTTKCVLNIVTGVSLMCVAGVYIVDNDFGDEEQVNQSVFFQIVNYGISIWGLVLYLSYYQLIYVESFRLVIFIEFVVFWIWVGTLVITCLATCLFVCISSCISEHFDEARVQRRLEKEMSKRREQEAVIEKLHRQLQEEKSEIIQHNGHGAPILIPQDSDAVTINI